MILCVLCIVNINVTDICAQEDVVKVVVDEDFENYQHNGPPGEDWEFEVYNKDIGVYADIVEDPEDSNNSVLKYIRESGDLVWVYRYFEPIGGKVYIDYRFMLSETEAVLYLGRIDGVYALMTYQGAYVFESTTIPNISTTLNVWHDFHGEIDLVEHTFTAMIDGDIVMDHVEINSDIESIDHIYFGFAEVWTMIDDLKISYEGGIVTNYTKLSVDEYTYNNTLKGIYNVPMETEQEEFLENCTFVDGAVYGLYESDGKTPYTKRFIDDLSILKIQSPDMSQEVQLSVNIQPWVASLKTVNEAYKCVIFFEDDCDMIVKNKRQYIDEDNTTLRPFVKDSHMYIPIRALSEAFNIDVAYNEQTKSVSIGGQMVECETVIVEGRTFMKAKDATQITGKKLLVNKENMVVFADDSVVLDDIEYTIFVNEVEARRK